MKTITYLKGDALNPIEVGGRKFICHVVNSWGVMGAGIALSIRKKWPIVYDMYVDWSKKPDFKLGEVQFITVKHGEMVVANMVGQEGVGFKDGIAPIRYNAIDSCLSKVGEACLKYNASVVSGRFGAGLAGGDWGEIEKLIIRNLCGKDIPVYIYDL